MEDYVLTNIQGALRDMIGSMKRISFDLDVIDSTYMLNQSFDQECSDVINNLDVIQRQVQELIDREEPSEEEKEEEE